MGEFLESIRPGLTLYGLLLTFSLFSFVIGRFFWRFERELQSDNMERLKLLMSNHRQRNIEPILGNVLTNAVSGGHKRGILDLMTALYVEDMAGQPAYTLVEDERIKEIVSRGALQERILSFASEVSVEEYLTTLSGEGFFDNLDQAYSNKEKLSGRYRWATTYCTRASYSFLLLGLLLMFGLFQILEPWGSLLHHAWLLLCVEMLLLGAYCLVRMERFRRSLVHMWEELQIYGQV